MLTTESSWENRAQMGRTSARDYVEALLLAVHHAQYLQKHPHVAVIDSLHQDQILGDAEQTLQRRGATTTLARLRRRARKLNLEASRGRIKSDWIEPETLFWAAWRALPAGEKAAIAREAIGGFLEHVGQAAAMDPRPGATATRWSGTATASIRCCGRRWAPRRPRRSARPGAQGTAGMAGTPERVSGAPARSGRRSRDRDRRGRPDRDGTGLSRSRLAIEADPRSRPDHRRHAARAPHRRTPGRGGARRRAPPEAPLLSLDRVGRADRHDRHRHPVLPGPPGAHRPARRAGGIRGRCQCRRYPPLPASRDGARGELRVPPVRRSGMGAPLRLVHPAVRRGLPSAAVQPTLRPASAGLVRADASRGGLGRDLRGVAHPGARLALGICGLARGAGEARVLRPRPEGTRGP